MNEETVRAMADQLRQYATHFAPRDWCYTRDLGDLRPLHFGSRWPSIKTAVRYLAKGAPNLFPDDPDMRHPDLPEVQAIAVEMKRINDDYGRRVGGEAA